MYVLSEVVSRCGLEQRLPRVGDMLYDVILRDRAIGWRPDPFSADFVE